MPFRLLLKFCTACLVLSAILEGGECGMEKNFFINDQSVNFAVAEQACLSMGFDGLALLKSPEEYRYAVKISTQTRAKINNRWLGCWIGFRFDEDSYSVPWDDGSVMAVDMPYAQSLMALGTERQCGRLRYSDHIGLAKCDETRMSVCGKRAKTYREATGTTNSLLAPTNVTATLMKGKVASYTHCVLSCCELYLCRVAHFDHVTQICSILGPESYSGFQNDPNSTSFIRVTYI
ncbi:hypothetical protein PoB_006171700 [Plakobranchus ocellatus]|uniref:C-type lectin domain-containing protein n=1 Tax=Plakobranchus ocellatus TaxID=259542 RepID=A0AAV4CTJ7_9GAST|nr:hypothetical protein PoB_006171700 [Plakobranchus ocellatus]